MDELLHDRVEQLKVIEDRLERLLRLDWDYGRGWKKALAEVRLLRGEVLLMLQEAERQHAAF